MTTIRDLEVSAFRVPLDEPESDGTLTWDHTTVVVVEVAAGPERGLGATYGSAACATLISEGLADLVVGREALDIPASWSAMVAAVRNDGLAGIASMAISAVDLALWDLKAKLLELPLFRLLGAVRDEVPVYASGGFTSMDDDALSRQLTAWTHDDGFPRVKMKIGIDDGADPGRDVDRVGLARKSVGPGVQLFVDANGAYTRKQAIRVGRALAAEGVVWFEEPVSSDDLDGLREVREAIDPDVAAGEYAYDLFDVARLLPVVDALQADVTRCGGITGWLHAASLAASATLELSGHTAQSFHLHAACAVPNVRHLEHFADHERVDHRLFDGARVPEHGVLRPDPTAPGHGLTLKRTDVDAYRVA